MKTIGELAKSLNISKDETMKFLSKIEIDVIDYNFNDDLETIENFLI